MIAFIFICNIISSYGFVQQDNYNVLLKDNADFIIDLIITREDIEMISEIQLKEFIIKDKKQFDELEKIAMAHCNKNTSYKLLITTSPPHAASPRILVVLGKYNNVLTTFIGKLQVNMFKRQTTTTENYPGYDYVSLLNEYYEQTNEELRSNKSYRFNETGLPEYGAINSLKRIFVVTKYNNCSESMGIGLQAIICVSEDLLNHRQSTKENVARLRNIFQIWFLVYLAVAVPLWCTRGWCCCCLRCKFFKPRQTIEEAKKYIVSYPPGVFKNKNGPILYEPSEREKACYEEFEHFIKTL